MANFGENGVDIKSCPATYCVGVVNLLPLPQGYQKHTSIYNRHSTRHLSIKTINDTLFINDYLAK